MDYRKLALLKGLNSPYDYKIILLLMEKSYTLTMLANQLSADRTNLYKHVKKLQELQLITIDRVEGKNKFYRLLEEI